MDQPQRVVAIRLLGRLAALNSCHVRERPSFSSPTAKTGMGALFGFAVVYAMHRGSRVHHLQRMMITGLYGM